MEARVGGLRRGWLLAVSVVVLVLAVAIGSVAVTSAFSADHEGALAARDAGGRAVDGGEGGDGGDREGGGTTPGEEAPAAEPVRIALLGDSVTQGSAGDATWRYYLDYQLRLAGEEHDLVGYRNDLYDLATRRFGSQEYADPAFDTDHAARWGMRLDDMDVSTQTLVSTTRPDVLVEMLGINDLRGGVDPAVVLTEMRTLVADARAAQPGIDVVLVRLPHWWVPEFAAFNDGLVQLAAELDTPEARVVVADADTGFDRARDTSDLLHPNDLGQRRIGDAVARALAGIGVGDGLAGEMSPALP